MAFNLSPTAQNLVRQINKQPQLILKVEGLEDIIFGSQPVLTFTNWDQAGITWDQDGVKWDGLTEDAGSRNYITFNGTTTNVSQQILPDKGGSSSISTMRISLLDKDGEVSGLLSFDNITETLGRKCDAWIGFANSEFPRDYVPVFRGVLTEFYNKPGEVNITISHPSVLQRQASFVQYTSSITSAMDNSQTTVDVVSTNALIIEQSIITPYIRIEDEIMRVTSILSPTQFQVTRGEFQTIPVSHAIDSEVSSVYSMTDEPIYLALKLMLSNDGNTYFNSYDVPTSINFISPTESIPNAVIFNVWDIQEITGLVVGDTIKLDSAANTGTYTILSFGKLETKSYITTVEPLVLESEYTGTLEYRSQFNVLPTGAGCGMLPFEVDVAGHLGILQNFPTSFVPYTFVLDETVEDTKAFIENEVYWPQGLFAIPRKARASVSYSTAPFSSDIVPTLNTNTIVDITSIKQRRSGHKYLYNQFIWKYNWDVIDAKFLSTDVVISGDSVNRIKLGRKPLTIEAKGLTRSVETSQILDQISRRFDSIYKFAPTYFDQIKVGYGTGLKLEVNDSIPFGGADTQFRNLQDGSRTFPEQLYKIINKSLNIKTGEVSLDIVQTGFEIQARYCVISMASFVGSNSTTTKVFITKSFDVGEYVRESDKWLELIGEKVRVRSEDYTRDGESIFTGVDPQNINVLVFDPPLPFAPLAGDIVEPAIYDESSIEANERTKIRFTHWTYQGEIASVTDDKTFDVVDATQLYPGSFIYVHSDDYTRDSFDALIEIDTIVGNTVTLISDLPFTPVVGDKVERTNFLDGGFPYVLL